MRIEDAAVFLKLAEQLNIGRTAECVGLTQSAVTKVVQRLESEFGLKLVERGASGVVLTKAGVLMRRKAQALRASFDSLRHEMAAAQLAQTGTVRIGTVPALLDAKLLPLLATWRRNHQGHLLQISVKVSDALIEMVSGGQLDLAVCFSPTPRSDLQSRSLGPQRYHVVARAGHPLAQPGEGTMAALSRAQWLLPAASVGMRRWVEEAFGRCGLPAPVTAVQTDTSTAHFSSLIRSSDLLTALMTPMLRSPAGQGLVELAFASANDVQPLVLLTRRAAYLSPAAVSLRDAIQQAFVA